MTCSPDNVQCSRKKDLAAAAVPKCKGVVVVVNKKMSIEAWQTRLVQTSNVLCSRLPSAEKQLTLMRRRSPLWSRSQG